MNRFASILTLTVALFCGTIGCDSKPTNLTKRNLPNSQSSSQPSLTGTWRGTGAQPDMAPYPMVMSITQKGNEITGTINWPTLRNSTTRFIGTINGSKVRFVETELISGSGIGIPCVYEGELLGNTIAGTCVYADQKATFSVSLSKPFTTLSAGVALGKRGILVEQNHQAPEEIRRNATLTVWNAFIKIGNESQKELQGKHINKKLAQGFRNVSLQLASLPALNVEPELMTIIGKITTEINEIAAVCALMDERQQFSHDVLKAGEALVRGPRTVAKEFLDLEKRDKDKWDQIDERMRKNLSELQALRVKFTTKYGIEFPTLGAWR